MHSYFYIILHVGVGFVRSVTLERDTVLCAFFVNCLEIGYRSHMVRINKVFRLWRTLNFEYRPIRFKSYDSLIDLCHSKMLRVTTIFRRYFRFKKIIIRWNSIWRLRFLHFRKGNLFLNKRIYTFIWLFIILKTPSTIVERG